MDLYAPMSVLYEGRVGFFESKEEAINAYQNVVTQNANHGGGPVTITARSEGVFLRMIWTPGVPIAFGGEWSE